MVQFHTNKTIQPDSPHEASVKASRCGESSYWSLRKLILLTAGLVATMALTRSQSIVKTLPLNVQMKIILSEEAVVVEAKEDEPKVVAEVEAVARVEEEVRIIDRMKMIPSEEAVVVEAGEDEPIVVAETEVEVEVEVEPKVEAEAEAVAGFEEEVRMNGENHIEKQDEKPRIPTVLLAGTQKASTSSLFFYLKDHQTGKTFCAVSDKERCYEGWGKEAHFFDDGASYAGGLEKYQELFRLCTNDDDLVFDGTPETMLHPEKVKKIYDEQGTSDQLKIIFILREPVSREVSWYNHRLRYTQVADPPGFSMDLFNKEGEIKSFIVLLRRTVIANFRKQQWKYCYGNYIHWLRLWCSFFDRKQILILSYDELHNDPAALLDRIHKFLDIPVTGELAMPHVNTNAQKTPPPPCNDQLELAEYFKGPNEELYKFLEENPGPDMEQRPFPKFELACQPLHKPE